MADETEPTSESEPDDKFPARGHPRVTDGVSDPTEVDTQDLDVDSPRLPWTAA